MGFGSTLHVSHEPADFQRAMDETGAIGRELHME